MTQDFIKLQREDFPAAIERDFRHELGRINIHLCFGDCALREFAHSVVSGPDRLRRSLRAAGHRNLEPSEISVSLALNLGYSAHLAFLLSRLDILCQRLRRHPWVDKELNNAAKGDYLRRTLWVILQTISDSKIITPMEQDHTHHYLSQGALEDYDQCRTHRNDSLHSDTDSGEFIAPRFQTVLGLSKSLQVLAREICRTLSTDLQRTEEAIWHEFKHLSGPRRRNAVFSALRQEFLLDGADAEQVISQLAW